MIAQFGPNGSCTSLQSVSETVLVVRPLTKGSLIPLGNVP